MSAGELLKQANRLKRSGRLDEAIALYHQVIDINPHFAWAYHGLGDALAKQGNLDQAVACYSECLKIHPNSAWLYYSLGDALAEQGDLEAAVQYLQKAIELKPDCYKFYNSLGWVLMQQKKFDDALNCYNQAIKLNSKVVDAYKDGVKSARLYNLLGQCFYNLGKAEQSIDPYKKAIDIDPLKCTYCRDLAVALAQIGDFDSSLENFEKAIRLSPIQKRYYMERSSVFMKIGNFEQAQTDLEIVLKLEPNNTKAQEKYNTLLSLRKELALQVSVDFDKAERIRQKIQSFKNYDCIDVDAVGYLSSFSNYGNQILELVKANPGQMSFEEYLYIVEVMLQSAPGNFLVFGLGQDSNLWLEVNRGGRTVFLEDNLYWLNKITAVEPTIESYLVKYDTKIKDWIDHLKNISNHVGSLSLELPQSIKNTAWEWILVDAPRGTNDETPGRMKSIYTAASLAKQHRNTHIFVHDCNRNVESIYSGYFIGNQFMVKQIEKLNHYFVSFCDR
ncbi:MAG: TIGR01627 domain-containing protein [Limnospira maxima]|uniref:TIGR01627 domain-containing protein n=1 Tax=Limnospira sp. PMC 1281.21 TaxID=2981064 RepID=UPI0028E5A700|nr:TIGR01627 domain-containing protein [Limnospira sp. PMC 1281.21]